jgi:hypothetical protein
MASPLTVKRNEYRTNPKRSDIPTPLWLCEQVASLFPDVQTVLDPACGDGRLLAPFKRRGCKTVGYDVKQGTDFLFGVEPVVCDLCVCNPPFNLGVGRMLGSEVFLRKILARCGNVPIALFCPMGFRLNQRMNSARWKWLRDECPAKITSLMALPLDCFEGVEFHAEIVFFNARHLEPHLFCTPNTIRRGAASASPGETGSQE